MLAWPPATARDRALESLAGDRAGGRGGRHVGAEGELGVDLRLGVIGGGEHREVHAEGEQQPEHDQPTVDRPRRGAPR